MINRTLALTTALTLTIATLGQAGAAEQAPNTDRKPTFTVPAVIGAAYHDRNVALNAVDVRRQGGLLVPAATQWLVTTKAAPVVAFKAPAVITVAYGNPRVAVNAAEVRRQGGFASAGAVQWLPQATTVAEVKTGNVKLGAL